LGNVGVIFLGVCTRASINIWSWEGTGVSGRGGSCASKDTGSTQASASSAVAGEGGVRKVVDAASLVHCVGKTARKHSSAKRWMEMASWAFGSAELA
jgi:hypothetical protein